MNWAAPKADGGRERPTVPHAPEPAKDTKGGSIAKAHIDPDLLPDLTPCTSEEDAALRDSIEAFGVLVPIMVDQYGRILDGCRRFVLALQVRTRAPVDVVSVKNDEHARSIRSELNTKRRHLTREQRQAMVARLVECGHSVRSIAKTVDCSTNTVMRDKVELSRSRQLAQPATVTGLDGKRRPSRLPIIRTRSPQEANRAMKVLSQLGDDAPAGHLGLRRAETLALEANVTRRRQGSTEIATTMQGCDLRVGDFRDVLADIKPDSVDFIFTDPPYMFEEDIKLYSDLAVFAARVLKPNGGWLMTYCGPPFRYEAEGRLREHLTYVHLGNAPLTRRPILRGINVAQGSIPLLWFSKGKYRPFACLVDEVSTSALQKEHHKWEKPVETARYYIEEGTSPGSLICDPFMGSGTTAVACVRAGRRFVGCDLDPGYVAIARERLVEEPHKVHPTPDGPGSDQ